VGIGQPWDGRYPEKFQTGVNNTGGRGVVEPGPGQAAAAVGQRLGQYDRPEKTLPGNFMFSNSAKTARRLLTWAWLYDASPPVLLTPV